MLALHTDCSCCLPSPVSNPLRVLTFPRPMLLLCLRCLHWTAPSRRLESPIVAPQLSSSTPPSPPSPLLLLLLHAPPTLMVKIFKDFSGCSLDVLKKTKCHQTCLLSDRPSKEAGEKGNGTILVTVVQFYW